MDGVLSLTVMQEIVTMNQETITLGGGCFWCTEAVFDRVRGVLDVESGYCNGHVPQPSYEQVCRGDTGHAEVVRLTYDPQQVSLRELLEIFFLVHDPTTRNRQGNDIGPQYRSGIYWHTEAQRGVAEDIVRELGERRVFATPIVTEVQAEANYWPAEDYHQDYFLKHPNQGYCAFVVAPKVHKFRETFARLVKSV